MLYTDCLQIEPPEVGLVEKLTEVCIGGWSCVQTLLWGQPTWKREKKAHMKKEQERTKRQNKDIVLNSVICYELD